MRRKIGIIGAGFIVDGCHLPAYRQAGYTIHGVASRHKESAQKLADKYAITNVYNTWQDLVADPEIEILDIAFPPDQQLAVIQEAAKHSDHIKGILAQKPLAMNLPAAKDMVHIAEDAGIALAVNSNMRYDQSIRCLKTLIDEGILGTPVIATIEMRAIPDWQDFLQEYDRIELLNMGIHHIDTFRHLFGTPEKITAIARPDPRTKFPHIDGITQYSFQYSNGLLATSLDDVWAGPVGEIADSTLIRWRVEGLEGVAEGTIGWHRPVDTPSTIRFTHKGVQPRRWECLEWDGLWFPDAFQSTMGQLMVALENGHEPDISGRDNLETLACVEACYQSIKYERTILVDTILNETK